MPTLRNPKHEKFAQLVASGMAANAAFAQVGYRAPQNSPRLRNNDLVGQRIEELQVRNERKAEMAALTRDELVGILTDIVHAARSRCKRLALPTDSRLLRCWPRCAAGTNPRRSCAQRRNKGGCGAYRAVAHWLRRDERSEADWGPL